MPPDASLIFPPAVVLEGIAIQAYESPQALFARIIHEARAPGQTLICHHNVHGANMAARYPRFKQILQTADSVYCDGAGIALGARLCGTPFPARLTGADWILDGLAAFAEAGCTVYFLGGEPGISDRFLSVLQQLVPGHSVVGHHHGYFLNDPTLQEAVLADINAKRPDILFVGFGMPLQEYWIADYRHRLNASVVIPIGAVMDYFTGKLSRCPQWMGAIGLEWLYRLLTEPKRLFTRYVVGNPAFLSRILAGRLQTVYSRQA